MTNTKFIKSLADAHSLAEIFIIEATYRYAEQCAVERLLEEHFISPDTRQQCALNIKTIIENRK